MSRRLPAARSRRHLLIGVLCVSALILLGGSTVATSATPALESGTYSVTVNDGGTTFASTWTLKVSGGSITGTSVWPCCGFTDPLSGSVQGTGARITRSCGPAASARFKDCADQIYTFKEGANGVLTGTAVGFGILPDTTATMQLASQRKPSLTVSVAAAVPDAGVGVPVTVTVKVTAGAKKLTAVGLGKGLTVGGEAAKVISAPSGISGFSLAAGGSRSFSYKVKGVKLGTVKLSASATGKSGSESVSGSGGDTLRIGKAALAISIVSLAEKTALKKFPLDVTDKGKVLPRRVTVKVKVTNTSKLKITGVSLESLRPVPVERTQKLDQLGFPRGTFPVKLGTFAPGATATRTFTLEATGDGKYELHALALYDDAGTSKGDGVAVATDGEFEATVPPLFYTATLSDDNLTDRNGSKWVKAGKWFFISGKVKNLSSYQSLCLHPLRAKRVGNASGTGPVDVAIYGAHETAPPLAGGLKPGQDKIWGLWVETSPVGGVRATIKLNPGAAAVEPGDSCEVERVLKLKPAQVKATKDSTDFVVHVDVSEPVFPELGYTGAAWNFFLGAPLGAIQGVAVWIERTIATARELVSEHLSPAGLVSLTVKENPAIKSQIALAEIYGSSAKLVELLAHYWETATPAEKQSLTTQVTSVLSRSSNDAYAGAIDGAGQALNGWFSNVEAVYGNPNNPSAWQALGTTSTSGATQVVIDIAVAELGTRIAKRAPGLARTFEKFGDHSVTYKTFKEMPPGKYVNFSEMKDLWGFAKSDIAAFKQIAEEEGVLIGIRGRSPVSVRNLEEGAVWKHENVKPKNVSDLDIKWLGFKKEDKGLVAMIEYSPAEQAAIEKRIANTKLTPGQQKELAKRVDIRFNEARKYRAKLEKFSKEGEIDIGFNYSENGIGKPTSPKPRGFNLDESTGPNGSRYFRPLQENTTLDALKKLPKWCKNITVKAASKVMCRLTGDMDGVYLADLDSTSLSEAKVLQVYERLEAAGWQHPETVTWVEQMTGKFWFEDKAKILKGLEIGNEAMVEFSPRGIRATFIDLAKSKLTGIGDWYLDVVGGYTTQVGRVAAAG